MYYLDELIIDVLKDFDADGQNGDAFAYPRTIRNILIGNEDATVIDSFKNKYYYGVFDCYELSVTEVKDMLEELVDENQVGSFITYKGKTRYYAFK